MHRAYSPVHSNAVIIYAIAIHLLRTVLRDRLKNLSSNNNHKCNRICDMIKGNESDVTDIVFEILDKKEFKFLCFILFSALINC